MVDKFGVWTCKTDGGLDQSLELRENEVVRVIALFTLLRLFPDFQSMCLAKLKLVWLSYVYRLPIFGLKTGILPGKKCWQIVVMGSAPTTAASYGVKKHRLLR